MNLMKIILINSSILTSSVTMEEFQNYGDVNSNSSISATFKMSKQDDYEIIDILSTTQAEILKDYGVTGKESAKAKLIQNLLQCIFSKETDMKQIYTDFESILTPGNEICQPKYEYKDEKMQIVTDAIKDELLEIITNFERLFTCLDGENTDESKMILIASNIKKILSMVGLFGINIKNLHYSELINHMMDKKKRKYSFAPLDPFSTAQFGDGIKPNIMRSLDDNTSLIQITCYFHRESQNNNKITILLFPSSGLFLKKTNIGG